MCIRDRQKIENTSGSITWDLEEKSFFYSRLDKFHRPKQIFKHILGTSTESDELIFEEKDETFTVGISLSSDDKWFIIRTGNANTTEEWFFPSTTKEIKPKLFRARKKDIKYSLDSWKDFFYVHTNENASQIENFS